MSHYLRKSMLIPVILFAGVLFTGHAMAGGIPAGRWWRMPQASALKLTDAEKNEMDDLFVQNRRELIQLKSTVEKERFELENLFDGPAFDRSAAMAQYRKLEKARANLAEKRFRFLLRVREILGFDRYQLLKIEYRKYKERQRKQ